MDDAREYQDAVPVREYGITVVLRDSDTFTIELGACSAAEVDAELADAKRAFRGEYRSITAFSTTRAYFL